LSEAIYGAPGYPQRLQQDLLRLVSSGEIERRGEGSPADPYTYHPIRFTPARVASRETDMGGDPADGIGTPVALPTVRSKSRG
jgi:hypothetical protein